MRPRVIIADLDRLYILPLQQKFVKEFYDNIDLEIITDRQYFDELFVTPQTIDILIVAEQLYNPLLQKHNIKHLYILSESEDNEAVAGPSGSYIYKYTSIIDIFEIIKGSSAAILNAVVINKTAPKIITVYSASGGAGKTTMALGLSLNLASRYKRVLYVAVERLQASCHLFNCAAEIDYSDYYHSLQKTDGAVYEAIKPFIQSEKFDYVPLLNLSTVALDIAIERYNELLLTAKASNDYDYIIVDSDSTFDAHKANLIDLSDRLIVIYEQTKRSINKTNAFLRNIEGNQPDKYIFVCNKYQADNPIESAADLEYRCNFKTEQKLDFFVDYEIMNIESLAKAEAIHKIAYLIM